MFDNVAFEVVIGLVFIYLLYSLLVTILGEIISNFVGMRARLLRVAVERMLNDGYYYRIYKEKQNADSSSSGKQTNKKDNETWWRGPALKEHPEFRKSFAGKFYDYPAIKYLGRIEKEKKGGDLALSKPSYISADYFADSLINFLADKGAGATLMDKVGFCLRYNPYLIQPNTRRQFINLYESANTLGDYKQNIIKWFNETMDRTTGWHKRKMRYLSFLVGLLLAIAFNVDTIKIVAILANDKEARAQLVTMGTQLAKDSSRYQEFITRDGDTIPSKAIIDTGFARLQKDIHDAGFVLGLGWDFSDRTKAYRIQAADSLATPAAQLKERFEKNGQISGRINQRNSVLKSYQFALDSLYQDTTIALNLLKIAQAEYNDAGINSAVGQFTTDTLMANNIRSLYAIEKAKLKTDSLALQANNQLARPVLNKVSQLTNEKFVAIDSITGGNKPYIHGSRRYNLIEKIGSLLLAILVGLPGFLITALALSMGAPFWFDLLNKLISIRGVGIKPEEKKPQAPSSSTAASTTDFTDTKRPEDIIIDKQEAALAQLTTLLKTENDIVGIALVSGTNAHLLVMVETGEVAAYLQQKYGAIQTVGTGYSIPVVFEVQAPISTHEGQVGGEIRNETGALGFGTLGCFLKKKNSSKNYILSCWHVMKDNAQYTDGIINRKIMERTSNHEMEIASVETGCLADCMDIGIALCNDQVIQQNPEHVIKSQHRPVTAYDELVRTNVTLYGKVSKKQKAVVFHHKINAQLTYPGGQRVSMNDVFSITVKNNNGAFTAPTSPGDSGAVVIDEKGTPMGMIIGGNSTFSYAVKFSNIFDKDKPFKEFSFLI